MTGVYINEILSTYNMTAIYFSKQVGMMAKKKN